MHSGVVGAARRPRSRSGEEDAVVRRLSQFSKALKYNPLIQQGMERRNFEFVEVLENARQRTSGGQSEYELHRGLDTKRGVVTWEMVVTRFNKYVRAHMFDSDQSTCILMLNVFRSHLRKGRRKPDTVEVVDRSDLDEEHYEKYQQMQVGV